MPASLKVKLERTLSLITKANADRVLVAGDVCGMPGWLWLDEVPAGGAQVAAMEFTGYGTDPLNRACRFCAVLKASPAALWLDDAPVVLEFADGEVVILPAQ